MYSDACGNRVHRYDIFEEQSEQEIDKVNVFCEYRLLKAVQICIHQSSKRKHKTRALSLNA